MKIYKCYYGDDYHLSFRDDGKTFYGWSDGSLTDYSEHNYSKVEPFAPVDTLQEVVDWCKENKKEVKISPNNCYWIANNIRKVYGDSEEPIILHSDLEILNYIKQNKHTPEELEVLELAKKYGIKIELK